MGSLTIFIFTLYSVFYFVAFYLLPRLTRAYILFDPFSIFSFDREVTHSKGTQDPDGGSKNGPESEFTSANKAGQKEKATGAE